MRTTIKTLAVLTTLLAGCGAHKGASKVKDANNFSEDYGFVQLNDDGTYSADTYHAGTATGTWTQSGRQATLTENGTGFTKTRTLLTKANLTPFLDRKVTTSWQPGEDDGMITYRAFTLGSDGSYTATLADSGKKDSGTWVEGYSAYSRKLSSGAMVPELGSALKFVDGTGSDNNWSETISVKGSTSITVDEDVTDAEDGSNNPVYQ